MSGSSFVAFREAVYAFLNADVTLRTLLGGTGRILTNVPQDAVFPYLYFELSSTPWDAKDFTGRDYTLRTRVFDEAESPKKAEQIATRVYDLLNRASIPITGFDLLDCWQEGQIRTDKDPEGRVYQVDVPFRAIVS